MKSLLIIVLFVTLTAFGQVPKEVLLKVENPPNGYCQVLRSTYIIDGKDRIGPNNFRYNFEPGADLSILDENKDFVTDKEIRRIKAICKASWTPEVIKKFKDDKAKAEAAFNQKFGGK